MAYGFLAIFKWIFNWTVFIFSCKFISDMFYIFLCFYKLRYIIFQFHFNETALRFQEFSWESMLSQVIYKCQRLLFALPPLPFFFQRQALNLVQVSTITLVFHDLMQIKANSCCCTICQSRIFWSEVEKLSCLL